MPGFSDAILPIEAGCCPDSHVGLERAHLVPWSHTAASQASAGDIEGDSNKGNFPYIPVGCARWADEVEGTGGPKIGKGPYGTTALAGTAEGLDAG